MEPGLQKTNGSIFLGLLGKGRGNLTLPGFDSLKVSRSVLRCKGGEKNA